MIALLDSSVLVAALAPDEPSHIECLALLNQGKHVVWAHAFLATFSTLTGGRLGFKVDAQLAAELLKATIQPRVVIVELSVSEFLAGMVEARQHGVRGGAVYDYMHLIAARKAKAGVVYTHNLNDFKGLQRMGDPEIQQP